MRKSGTRQIEPVAERSAMRLAGIQAAFFNSTMGKSRWPSKCETARRTFTPLGPRTSKRGFEGRTFR